MVAPTLGRDKRVLTGGPGDGDGARPGGKGGGGGNEMRDDRR